MTQLAVIADDLTGASDAGAQCALLGIRSVVVTANRLPQVGSLGDAAVVIVDTESRHVPPDEAGGRVRAAVAWARTTGATRFYKKTDSTLRGNIGAELQAVLEATGSGEVCFVPAYPAAGRTTVNGLHYVDNVLLHESDFGNDPLSPMRESSVTGVLAAQTGLSIRSVPLNANGEHHCFGGIAVMDARTERDVERIARALAQLGADRVAAGPVGFLGALLPQWNLPRPGLHIPPFWGALLIVNGSLNPVALSQVAYAVEHGFRSVCVGPGDSFSDRLRAHEENACAWLANGSHVVVHTACRRDEEHEYLAAGAQRGLSAEESRREVVNALARLTARIVAQVRQSELFLSKRQSIG